MCEENKTRLPKEEKDFRVPFCTLIFTDAGQPSQSERIHSRVSVMDKDAGGTRQLKYWQECVENEWEKSQALGQLNSSTENEHQLS